MPAPSTPADKSTKPDKPKRPPSSPRRKNRFNEREFARAARAARAVGANGVSCDPKTGVYTITFSSDKNAGGQKNPWDEVLNNAADKERSA